MATLSYGLHHVSAMAGRAQANIEFYVRFLGLRLVKRTVNFDDPQTYHLYFGDALGNPGSLLTFFPWPGAGPAVRGQSEAVAVALRVPPGAVSAWRERLEQHGLPHTLGSRFGRELLAFGDPDGTPLELIEGEEPPAPAAPSAPGGLDILAPTRYWTGSSVPAEHAIVGLDSVTLSTASPAVTADLLAEVLGWQRHEGGDDDGGATGTGMGTGTGTGMGTSTGSGADAATGTGGSGSRLRLTPAGVRPELATAIDLVSVGPAGAGRLGTGSVHHVAFRVADDEALERGRELLLAAGARPTTPKNRLYFRSVYFRDPAGAILELATDTPGFTVDEPADELGLALRLPDWLEPDREFLRAQLPVTASPEYADRFL